jgi:hypothetical protein
VIKRRDAARPIERRDKRRCAHSAARDRSDSLVKQPTLRRPATCSFGRRASPFPFSFSLAGRGTWSAGKAPSASARRPGGVTRSARCADGKTAHAPPTAKGQAPPRRSILALSVPGAAASRSSAPAFAPSFERCFAAGSYCPAGGFPDLPSPRLRAAAAGRQIPLRLQDRLENTAPYRARRVTRNIGAFCSQYIM